MASRSTSESNDSPVNADSSVNADPSAKRSGSGGWNPPTASPSFPKLESEVLQFWDDRDIYARSLQARENAPAFVFFEGPPTANGLPHPGHCLTRAIKDVFPRYKTMQGYRCHRKAGWDTHGLPVEVEVSKDLGIHNRDEIVEYGEEAFIQKCQQSVFRYIGQWQEMTRRLGFWVDLDDAYVTYHQSYVESVWWSLKNLFDRGLLYYGHKIVWWWAQGGTALSSGEVGEGYREVADPSVYVKFPLLDHPGRSLVVWTTTPWTLPSNMYAAVHPNEVSYVVVRDPENDEEYVVAEALLETLCGKLRRELEVVSKIDASDLIGQRYTPPFDHFPLQTGNPTATTSTGRTESLYWKVVAADFVTTDAGTGVVHLAPAFGEVDYEIFQHQRGRYVDTEPELLYCVGPDGKFDASFEPTAGMWVKDADKPLCKLLRASGRLLLLDQYLHDYPFCWRAKEDPLIQYPRSGWFIRTTRFKELMLKNNSQITWLPEHIRDGRFGNFLRSNVDWELSRERFWGTPLPVWVCEKTGHAEAVGSYEELMAKSGVRGTEVFDDAKAKDASLVEDLRVHKPYIDAVTYDSPRADGARMRRVTDVIDCWYDSGAMPFAQWGWPHQNDDRFRDQYPADFISEAIDQTRGWFYSQLAIATMLFGEGSSITAAGVTSSDETVKGSGPGSDNAASASSVDSSRSRDPLAEMDYPLPFQHCIVLGLMLGEDGNKMSKKDRNYREPSEIFDKYGADALRWFLYSGQTPWTSIRYREQTIKDSIPEFLLRLWNCYSFLAIYADIDGFAPHSLRLSAAEGRFSEDASCRPVEQRPEIDRWILSELDRTVAIVTERMDALDNYNACAALHQLVDSLSNWYVRRSRDRFWASEADSSDKLDAYWTLYESLVTVSQLIAPFTPFFAETLYRSLTAASADDLPESVHLTDYPRVRRDRDDEDLARRMGLLREIASLGRAARADAKLKVRLPLSKVEVVLADDRDQGWLAEHDELVRKELNVKAVDYTTDGEQYVDYSVVPNFRRLGPKVGKAMPKLKKTLAAADGGELLAQLKSSGKVEVDIDGQTVTLDDEDLEVRLQAKAGWTAAQGASSVVVLNTEVTDDLRREGTARDLIRVIQNQRKAIECDYADRIHVVVKDAGEEIHAAIDQFAELICEETLATEIQVGEKVSESVGGGPTDDDHSVDFEGATVRVTRLAGSGATA